MPKYAASVDVNQTAIVRGLRAAGCTVWITSALGKGAGDIVAGFRGRNYIMEIKRPELRGKKRELTPLEQEWISEWRGQVDVVHDLDEALRVVGLL